MSKLDPNTGYPPGHVPYLWRCPECGDEFRDSEQRGLDFVAWECDAMCGPCGPYPGTDMVRVRPLTDEEAQA